MGVKTVRTLCVGVFCALWVGTCGLASAVHSEVGGCAFNPGTASADTSVPRAQLYVPPEVWEAILYAYLAPLHRPEWQCWVGGYASALLSDC
jgi:hypothetical protein